MPSPSSMTPSTRPAALPRRWRPRAYGDDEAMGYDYDYVRALEYGMPPAGGIGYRHRPHRSCCLTTPPAIRDVLLLPADAVPKVMTTRRCFCLPAAGEQHRPAPPPPWSAHAPDEVPTARCLQRGCRRAHCPRRLSISRPASRASRPSVPAEEVQRGRVRGHRPRARRLCSAPWMTATVRRPHDSFRQSVAFCGPGRPGPRP